MRWLRGGRDREEFWALRDVSFEIGRGEAVGIIGRNGAGKSTLLKILSRITAPTTGEEVRLSGRIAALLEVGTGFHPEKLTGRENIFLNGAITHGDVAARDPRRTFDEIVEFSGVERFLDTPVKRYSSGMYVRLAFAVAAHLRPEIMVVDEVLAVGDARFQKKCLGKMQDVASGGGRTVLFVSHNMAAITRLCSRALLLRDGRIVQDGAVDSVVATYLSGGSGDSPISVDFEATGRVRGNEHARLLAARITSDTLRSTVIDIFAGRFASSSITRCLREQLARCTRTFTCTTRKARASSSPMTRTSPRRGGRAALVAIGRSSRSRGISCPRACTSSTTRSRRSSRSSCTSSSVARLPSR